MNSTNSALVSLFIIVLFRVAILYFNNLRSYLRLCIAHDMSLYGSFMVCRCKIDFFNYKPPPHSEKRGCLRLRNSPILKPINHLFADNWQLLAPYRKNIEQWFSHFSKVGKIMYFANYLKTLTNSKPTLQ